MIGFASNRKFPDRQEEGEVKANAPTTRWTVLSLYQTKGGNYVCHQANHSINPGEHDKMEALFECISCGYVANADINASRNILAVGHTVLSVEGRCSKGRPTKQKASEIRKEVA